MMDDQQIRQSESEILLDAQAAALQPGQMVGGKYRIISLLGRGGMGFVYKVEQVFLAKEFALKTLNPVNFSTVAWRRFQKEAQTVSRLNHPNLIRVVDFGLIDDQHPFLVMDLVEGTTLAQIIRKSGPLNLSAVFAIFTQVCLGLEHAHENGIVHRDIKPSNIIVDMKDGFADEPEVQIVDFGIAKITEQHELQALTSTGELLGSPLYMSPEQCRGVVVDTRSDMYSLGCVLFEALTGAPPFIGDSAMATMLKHQSEPTPTLESGSLGKDFPDGLQQVVERLLQKNPAQRYQTATEVCEDLARVKQGLAPSCIAPESATKKIWPIPVILLATITGIIIGTIVWIKFISGASTHSNVVSTETSTATGMGYVEDSKVDKWLLDRAYFSSVETDRQGRPVRIFRFPYEFSMGKIILGAQSAARTQIKDCDARGRVVLPDTNPVGFEPSWTCCQHPQLFTRFREDDLDRLILSRNEGARTAMLQIGSLTGLKELFVDHTDVGDEHLKVIGALPNLRNLRVDLTDVTGQGLAKNVNLRQLEWLHADSQGGSAIVAGLQGSTRIKRLFLEHTGLTDADLFKLAKLKTLEVLQIHINKHVTDKGLEALRKLPHLYVLNVHYCAVTTRCIPTLRTLRALTRFSISTSGWRESETESLIAALATLPQLETLHLFEFHLSAKAVQMLAKMPALNRLELDNQTYSPADLQNLRQSLPGCKVTVAGL